MNWHDMPKGSSEVAVLRAEMAELRREIAALKQFKKDCIPALGQVLRTMRKEIMAEIPKHRGVYCAGQRYYPNDQTTRSGSLWHCLKETTTAPGTSADWVMTVKSGQRGD
jgi:hypothetical protein